MRLLRENLSVTVTAASERLLNKTICRVYPTIPAIEVAIPHFKFASVKPHVTDDGLVHAANKKITVHKSLLSKMCSYAVVIFQGQFLYCP
jgi:hypothetical protein